MNEDRAGPGIAAARRRAAALCCAAALGAGIAAGPAAAQVPADPRSTAAIERFAALGFRQKAAVIRAIQRATEALDDPLARRIAALRIDLDELPAAPDAAPIHDPATYARAEHEAGRAPARTPVPADDPAHRAVRARFARPAFLPDLIREVRYDRATGRLVRGAALGYEELFTNAVHGFVPGSDHAVAQVLAALDRDPEMRQLGRWFAHGYCDLSARAYPPLTLYDAWYSGAIVDVPDVDAIPFAWEILGWKDYRSPLSGPPRDRLYEEIRRAAGRYRVHRTLGEAAAAALVRAEPRMDPMYALLVPRLHYLWANLDDDLEALAAKLGAEDRDELLEAVDRAIREPDGRAHAIREGRREALAALEERIRGIALAALERFGG
jgi:hypothetical protein